MPSGVDGNLDHQIGALHGSPQPPRFSDASLGIAGEMRRDFKAGVAISASRFVINRPKHIGGHANIFDGQRFKQRFFGLLLVGFQQLAQRVIIFIAMPDSLLENGRDCWSVRAGRLRLPDVAIRRF